MPPSNKCHPPLAVWKKLTPWHLIDFIQYPKFILEALDLVWIQHKLAVVCTWTTLHPHNYISSTSMACSADRLRQYNIILLCVFIFSRHRDNLCTQHPLPGSSQRRVHPRDHTGWAEFQNYCQWTKECPGFELQLQVAYSLRDNCLNSTTLICMTMYAIYNRIDAALE